jgi:hypothetical protein
VIVLLINLFACACASASINIASANHLAFSIADSASHLAASICFCASACVILNSFSF